LSSAKLLCPDKTGDSCPTERMFVGHIFDEVEGTNRTVSDGVAGVCAGLELVAAAPLISGTVR